MVSEAVEKHFEAQAKKQKEEDSLNKSFIRMSRRIDQLEENNKYLVLKIGELEKQINDGGK